ncbi:MAG: Enoyl-CoA hydratase [Solirubrobacterales bacterium]|nr:Enoyl-CoA hydratase [Solirubrobacterales bacterium]
MTPTTFRFEDAAPGVKLLTLDRPDRLNAVNWTMVEELEETFRALKSANDVRAVVVTGEGRAFCAGLDIKDPRSFDQDNTVHAYDLQEMFGRMCTAFGEVLQPVIAAVNGVASGAGFVFALASDMRIAVPEARFNMANVRIGFSGCDLGSSYWLPRYVGLGVASELLMTGRFMDATEAERRGIVNRLVDADGLLPAAIELAAEIARNSPFAVRMTKQVLRANVDSPSLANAVELENRTQILCTRTNDFEEALAAFQEKRDPQFTGS